MGEAPNTQRMTHDIADTRADLGRNVDELTDRVSPTRVVGRRVETARGRMSRVKESVMGSASDARDRVSGSASSAQGSVSSTAGEGVETARQRAQGNPLAAGLLAFGAGWLVSSLLPASEKEAQAAQRLEDTAKEHGQPVKEQASQVGREVGQNLKEQATQAADQVKSTAQESADHVRSEGQASTERVKSEGQSSTEHVRQQAPGGS